MISNLLCCALAAAVAPGTASPVPAEPAARAGHNVILVVVDDLGVDQLSAYGASGGPPTPTLERLAQEGVLFRNAYANPVCSPTRATLQTGRYSFRTGIGEPVMKNNAALSLAELTLPEMLALSPSAPYATAALGKWHLGNDSVGAGCAPVLAGYGHFSGTTDNIKKPESYFGWTKVVADRDDTGCHATEYQTANYATSDTVDEAVAWILAAPEPFFLHVGFHAPHDPLHLPPAPLHPTVPGVKVRCRDDPSGCFDAMVEALDLELDRLLAALDPALEARTSIVVVGDNGTDRTVIRPPYAPYQAKGTLFEGGIRVPLIVKSPFVLQPGREVDALVNTVDLFATVAELTGVDLSSAPTAGTVDGISLVPYLQDPNQPELRDTAFAELFSPNGPNPTWSQRALRNGRFKLIESAGAPDVLYDLQVDPYEKQPLDPSHLGPLALQNYLGLKQQLCDLLNSP